MYAGVPTPLLDEFYRRGRADRPSELPSLREYALLIGTVIAVVFILVAIVSR